MENLLMQECPVIFFNELEERKFDDLLTLIFETDMWEYVDAPTIQLHLDEDEENKLYIKLNGKQYSVLPQAMHSIGKRAMDEAKVNDKLPIKTRIRRLNEDFSVAYKKTSEPMQAKGLIRGGQLLALLSERYVPFTQKRIFDMFTFSLSIRFESVSFKAAVYTHSATEATYQVVDENILDLYRKALREVKHPLSEADMAIEMILSTSDVGSGCISVMPTLSFAGDRQKVPFCTALKVEHRDKTEFGDVERAFGSIFSLAEEGLKNFSSLFDVTIKNPFACAQNIAKKFYLPKLEIDELKPQLDYYADTGTTLTGHEFYLILSDILNSSKYQEMSAEKKLFVRDGLSKILTLSRSEWLKYDKPTL